MSFPAFFFILRCLIRDTFRHALATRTFWLMLTVSGLCIAFCLSLHIDGPRSLKLPDEFELLDENLKPFTGPNPHPGHVTLLFGTLRFPLFRDGLSEVRLLQSLLGFWVAGAMGLLATLVWTAGFLPAFLEPSSLAVLLAKPVPRWVLLLGKFLGVLSFVAFQAGVFFIGTWGALGMATGIWLPRYLLCLPLLLLHFLIIYSFSVLMAVCTRSTVACIFGSILFWFACFAMNFARHESLVMPALDPRVRPLPPAVHHAVETGYWILPKPGDLLILLDGALQAHEDFNLLPHSFQVVQCPRPFDPDLSAWLALTTFKINQAGAGTRLPDAAFTAASLYPLQKAQQCQGAFHPELSVLASLLFTAVILAIAAGQFAATDY